MKPCVATLVLATLVAVAGPARASLLGTTVSLTPVFASGAVQPTLAATVGSGVEFPSVPRFDVAIDFDATGVVITTLGGVFSNGPFNGFRFSFSDTLVTGATYVGGGLVPAAVRVEPYGFSVNYAGVAPPQGVSSSFIAIASAPVEPPANDVPEPASAAVLGLAAAGAGLLRRRADRTR